MKLPPDPPLLSTVWHCGRLQQSYARDEAQAQAAAQGVDAAGRIGQSCAAGSWMYMAATMLINMHVINHADHGSSWDPGVWQSPVPRAATPATRTDRKTARSRTSRHGTRVGVEPSGLEPHVLVSGARSRVTRRSRLAPTPSAASRASGRGCPGRCASPPPRGLRRAAGRATPRRRRQ